MKLFELRDYQKPTVLEPPYGLEFYKTYHFYPSVDHDARGNRVFFLQTYDFGSNRTRSYAIISPGEIHMRILPYDHAKDNKILRVRIVSGVEMHLASFNRTKNEIHRDQSGKIVTFPFTDHQEFTNFDSITDEEFEKKYGRVRNQDDHGLVGHLWIEDNTNFHSKDDEIDDNQQDKTKEDVASENKLADAIKIYAGSRNEKRKNVIKAIAARLGMTEAGATSYYTHAKHAIEDPKGKGKPYQHAVKAAKGQLNTSF